MSITPPDTLEIRSTPGKGRSLHATRAFSSGAVIATFSPPIALATSDKVHDACTQCLKTPGQVAAAGAAVDKVPLKKCNGCRAASYCGRACQRADWKGIHSRECKALAALPGFLPSGCRAVLQVLLLGTPAWAADLVDHMDKIRAQGGERWMDILLQAKMVAATYARTVRGREPTEAETLEAARMLCRLEANTFDRQDDATSDKGLFVEPVLAMANHSCVPNALVLSFGRKALLVADRPVGKGDEIEISYIDNRSPLRVRREELASWYFECRCPACTGDLNAYDIYRTWPTLGISEGDLIRDAAKLRAAAPILNASQRSLAREVQQSHRNLAAPEVVIRQCKKLVDANLWVIYPVVEVVSAITGPIMDAHQYDILLTITCFNHQRYLPYQYPSPYHFVRVRSLGSLAQLVSFLATKTAPPLPPPSSTIAAKIRERVEVIEAVPVCWALCTLFMRYVGPEHDEWDPVRDTRALLQSLEEIGGPGGAAAVWKDSPDSAQGREWFLGSVVSVVEDLADLGEQFLREQFLGNKMR